MPNGKNTSPAACLASPSGIPTSSSTSSPASCSSASPSSSPSRRGPHSLTAVSLLVLLLIALAVQSCSAQQYHFSNGWYPGKKRSSISPSGPHSSGSVDAAAAMAALTGAATRSSDVSCSVRTERLLMALKMLQEETARLQRNCISETPIGLRDLLEGTSSKLDEDKW